MGGNALVCRSSLNHEQSSYLLMFVNWCENLRIQLTRSLLPFSELNEFQGACQVVGIANQEKLDKIRIRDEIANHNPVNQDELKKANEAVQLAWIALDQKLEEASTVAGDFLKSFKLQSLLSDDFDDNDLITYTILIESGPAKLADWCDKDPNQAIELLTFLHDVNLMRTFLQSGGARKGEYPRAVEIFNQINPDPSNSVLNRIRLAVALELCSDYPMFSDIHKLVNPLLRYVHYEQSYLLGELDPSFSQFNVWEMRHIVNSDASEDDLGWGRQCLMNYRPDLVYSDSHQWRYGWIVRSDVSYNDVDWYKGYPSYDQILSGGGECGPRAWYGRFICKTFGIPTWGYQQPGHAAFARWTVDGWCTCLGAGFEVNYWEGECGLNFLSTTKAMKALYNSEDEYMKKVRRLEWVASFYNEDSSSVRGRYLPDSKTPWWSLSFFQRKLLLSQSRSLTVFSHPRIDVVPNLITRIKDKVLKVEHVKYDKETNCIYIPAVACSNPKTTTSSVVYMRCFSGGQQLYVNQNGVVEYKIHVECKEKTKYALTCSICTVHRKLKPIGLEISVNNNTTKLNIEQPYTMGFWKETTPVIVELDGMKSYDIVFRIIREMESFGFGLQSIMLRPLS